MSFSDAELEQMASEFEDGVTSELLEGAVVEPGPFWDSLSGNAKLDEAN